jgi:hypothetical protein
MKLEVHSLKVSSIVISYKKIRVQLPEEGNNMPAAKKQDNIQYRW